MFLVKGNTNGGKSGIEALCFSFFSNLVLLHCLLKSLDF
uniref:Uncharacterized protein n=1 Tax=Manihot esculenta TaxID=3983 RepID=A0A2C9VAM1_MANES